MSKIDIKVGETYYVRVKVTERVDNKIITQTVSANDSALVVSPTIFFSAEAPAFSHVPYFAPIEISKTNVIPEAYPKYDPRRKFRSGDKVRVVEWNGRSPVLPFMDCKVGDIGTVIKDEESTSFFVRLHLEGKYEKDMPYCHLELVTPVEELEPYYVSTNMDCSTCTIFKRVGEKELVYSAYYFVHGKGCSNAILGITEAKAAAEAERDRLNAECRKEMEK